MGYTLVNETETLVTWEGTNERDVGTGHQTKSNNVTSHDGNDSFRGGGNDDTLRGDDGDDIFCGFGGNDFIVGGNDNDYLAGGDGNDFLNGEGGNDTLFYRGNGNDTLRGGATGGLDKWDIEDTVNEDDTAGIVDFDGGFEKINLTSFGLTSLDDFVMTTGFYGVYNGTFLRAEGHTTIFIEGQAPSTLDEENFIFSGIYYASPCDVEVAGSSGDDSIFGHPGDDSLMGGAGDDTIVGDGGNDSLTGGGHNDSLNGNGGADTLVGATNNDFLNGGAGIDVLQGGSGNDTLFGAAGADTMTGGGNADVFVAYESATYGTVTDFTDAEDQLDFSDSGATGFGDLTLTNGGGGVTVEYDGYGLFLDGVSASELSAGDFIF